MAIECSACKSDNAQKMSLVYETGISSLDGKSTGVGIGVSRGGIGVGVGSSKVKGTQQTELSKRAAPPAKKRLLRNTILYVIGILLVPGFINSTLNIDNQVLQMLVGLGYLALAATHTYKSFMYNKKVWPELYQRWDRQYMCLKCGTVFMPTIV
jgi:hypothetical protein